MKSIQPALRFAAFVLRVSYRQLFAGLALVIALSAIAAGQNHQYVFGRMNIPLPTAPKCPVGGPCGVTSVTADFNKDGRLDLAVIDNPDNRVYVLLGQPDGSFSAPVHYATGRGPVALTTADFNGDGNLDLAVVNKIDGTVSILLGNGNGTFRTHVDYAVELSPVAVRVGDFNGDKKPDLVVANYGSNTVSVLLGKGDGSFQAPIDTAVSQPLDVVVSDFNRDGKEDIAVGNEYGGGSDVGTETLVLLGNGDGTFGKPTNTISGAGATVGDFNHDGIPDLATFTHYGQEGKYTSIIVSLGNGDGTFTENSLGQVVGGISNIVNGDFNGDGKLDLAAASYNANVVYVFLGNGDGTFQSSVASFAGPNPTGLLWGDFNGDGKLDLAARESGTLYILLGNGDGTFAPATKQTPLSPAAGSPPFQITADFNGDGIKDLAAYLGGYETILLGNGDGSFTNSVPFDGCGSPAAWGDFANNGIADIVAVVPRDAVVCVLIGNGDGTFKPAVAYPTADDPVAVAVGDFNKDGNLDLAVADGSVNAISILLGNGDGTFKLHKDFAIGGSPVWLTVGDFNKDGNLDLAALLSKQGGITVLLGKGDGTFGAPANYSAPQAAGSILTFDANGDGNLDLIAGGLPLSVLAGHGDGTFAAPVLSSCGGDSGGATGTFLRAGDVNGDGKMDVVMQVGSGYYPAPGPGLCLGNGNLTFSSGPTLGGNVLSPVVGDFSGGGTSDIAAITGPKYGTTETVFLNFPVVALYPTTLNFGSDVVGHTSAPLKITLADPGSAFLKITNIQIQGADPGDFVQTNECGDEVKVLANCTISVTFAPKAAGKRSATVVITDSAPTSPQTVTLTGDGT